MNNYKDRVAAMTTEELKSARFYLSMKDRWNSDDYKYDDALLDEIRRRKDRG